MSARPALKIVSGGDDGPAVDDRALADCGRDDIGNAERLIARHGQDLRRTPGLGYLIFEGMRWVLELDDPPPHALLRAQATARSMRKEADAIESEGKTLEGKRREQNLARVESHRKWAVQSANSARLNAMLGQAWPHLIVEADGWNANPRLFNCTNCTLDLTSIEVVEQAHNRDDYITHVAGVAYDPTAECPAFRGFIDRVLPPVKLTDGTEDRSLQKFVQRSLGVCLIDSAHDQAIVVHHGGGANGKSTLMNAIAAVLGDYAMTVAIQSILYSKNQSGSGPSPDIARLAERPRMVRVSEPEPGAQLAEGGVKSLTGGEAIVARRLNEPPIEFRPNFKMHVSCNTRPTIRGGDDGIWRRILLVPWKVQIPEEEQREKGPALEAAIASEKAGILNWLIEGLHDYYERGGLDAPESVREETLAYRTDSDVIGRFIAEACIKGEGREVEAGELYEAFKLWSKDEGMKEPLSASLFGRRLTDRGFAKRKSHGNVYRLALELTQEWQTRARESALALLERENAAAAREKRKRGDHDEDEA